MNRIAVIPNAEKPDAITCAFKIAELLSEQGAEVILPNWIMQENSQSKVSYCNTYEEIFANCDCAVTVGGDGTIIHIAPYAAAVHKPIIGVNSGRLGYVAELEIAEIDMLLKLLQDDYTIKNRMMLDVTILHSNQNSESYLAVNDAVISRGSLSCIIDLDVFHRQEKICNYRADGLLFSTPTGSTAYALSAGGPVIDPYLSLIEMTPVCPHSLSARTVVFADDTELSVKCNTPEETYLTVDGQISVKLLSEDVVCIRKSQHTLPFIVLKEKNFYKSAGEKLTNPQ